LAKRDYLQTNIDKNQVKYDALMEEVNKLYEDRQRKQDEAQAK